MKTKSMKRTEWWRLKECKFTYKTINPTIEAGLIQMQKLAEPLYVTYPHTTTPKCIAANGYSWLQLAFKNYNLWCTAMFDEQNTLLECYFDVTANNYLHPEGNSYFEDLYLDIIFFPDGTINLLDEDELLDALNKKIITPNQVEQAYTTAKQCIAWLEVKENQTNLISFCYQTFNQLKYSQK